MNQLDITAAIEAAKSNNTGDVVTWDGELKQILLNTLAFIVSYAPSQTAFNSALDGIATALTGCFRHSRVLTANFFEHKAIETALLPTNETDIYQFSNFDYQHLIYLHNQKYYIAVPGINVNFDNLKISINGKFNVFPEHFELNGRIYFFLGSAFELQNNPLVMFYVNFYEVVIVATDAIFQLSKNAFLPTTYYNSAVIGGQNLV
jgi:hypothetical protein